MRGAVADSPCSEAAPRKHALYRLHFKGCFRRTPAPGPSSGLVNRALSLSGSGREFHSLEWRDHPDAAGATESIVGGHSLGVRACALTPCASNSMSRFRGCARGDPNSTRDDGCSCNCRARKRERNRGPDPAKAQGALSQRIGQPSSPTSARKNTAERGANVPPTALPRPTSPRLTPAGRSAL